MEISRKLINDIIELHDNGKDVEQIMFSIGMVHEEDAE